MQKEIAIRVAAMWVFGALLALMTAFSVAAAPARPQQASTPGAWVSYPLPSLVPALEGVAMVSTASGWAVGDSGTILRWNGAGWLPEASGLTTATLEDASTVPGSPNEVWVVGLANHGVIFHRTISGTWTSVPSPVTTQLDSVAMISSTLGWIVGDRGLVMSTTNGLDWIQVSSPVTVQLHSVAMLNASEGWAVGARGTILHYAAGSGWNVDVSSSAGSNALYDLVVLPSGEAWAAGDAGTIVHRSAGASSWTLTPGNYSGTPPHLYAISMASPGDGYAAGTGNVVNHWDGTTWTPQPPNPEIDFPVSFIQMVSPVDGWAVGGDTNTQNSGLLLRYKAPFVTHLPSILK